MDATALPRSLVWFRRDLRDFDHAALRAALRDPGQVYCAFVYDRAILDPLPRADRRVEFIHGCVAELASALAARGGGLAVLHGEAREAIPALARELGVSTVHAARDYEPAAISRDTAVADALREDNIDFHLHKDQVVFEHDEVVTRERRPYAVFTPYRTAWLARLSPTDLAPRVTEGLPGTLVAPPPGHARLPTLAQLGFVATNLHALGVTPGMTGGAQRLADFRRRIARYRDTRDFPAVKGPSYLSVHLRFGTVSIRALASLAHERALRPEGEGAATWLSELVWREFYMQVLWHRPDVVDTAFRAEYAHLRFPDPPGRFEAWCAARTGYPLVDAAMRQLLSTGYMHNRLRMITASFLVKDLLVDWRHGERFFATHLIDFELASNNGGWQWAASTGCDAQPYFRIFNPVTQSERFDPRGDFIRRYVPELAALSAKQIHAPWKLTAEEQRANGVMIGQDYPPPIVDHAASRAAVLTLFGKR